MGPGEVVGGRFLIIGELGRGGMATVYLVDDQLRGERVALKVLHEHLADSPSARRRLRREVAATAKIHHPRALVAHDIHELDGRLGLTMPVHSGVLLSERVGAAGALAPEAVARIAADLAGALAAAHAQGIVHTDVTPNNVMLDSQGHATLMDFGLARLQSATQTATQTAAGTWGYAAPETFDAPAPDPRADLYSLGAVLYFVAAGRPPFDAATPAGVLRRQLTGDYASLDEVRPDLPAALRQTVHALLATAPADRPLGAGAVVEALEAGEAPLTEPAGAVAAASPAPTALAAPASAVSPSELGTYTVYVSRGRFERRRSRSLRRRRGPIRSWERADHERALAEHVARRVGVAFDPEQLPDAFRGQSFRLVEGVGVDLAQELAAHAESLGYDAEVVEASQGWRRASRGRLIASLLPFLAAVILPGAALLSQPGASFRNIIPGLLAVMMGGLFIARRLTRRRRARLVVSRAALASAQRAPAIEAPQHAPALSAPAALVTSAALEAVASASTSPVDPAAQVLHRTQQQLDALGAAVEAASGRVADAALMQVRDVLKSLRQRAAGLGEAARTLAQEHAQATSDPTAIDSVQRQLTRLQTRERAGEAVSPEEIKHLEGVLASWERVQSVREEAEGMRVQITARLLEIGASAVQATRALRRRDDLDRSLSQLLLRLETEAAAASEAAREVEAHTRATASEAPSGAARAAQAAQLQKA